MQTNVSKAIRRPASSPVPPDVRRHLITQMSPPRDESLQRNQQVDRAKLNGSVGRSKSLKFLPVRDRSGGIWVIRRRHGAKLCGSVGFTPPDLPFNKRLDDVTPQSQLARRVAWSTVGLRPSRYRAQIAAFGHLRCHPMSVPADRGPAAMPIRRSLC